MARVCALNVPLVDPQALTLLSGSPPSSVEAIYGSTGSAANKRCKSAHLRVDKPFSNSSSHIPLVSDAPKSLPTLSLDPDNSSLLQLTNAATFDGESEPMFRARTPHHTPVASSRSTPGLSRQLSTTLSSAILNDETVVHRPRLSARPTVNFSHFSPSDEQHTTLSPKTPMSEVPSLPSSILSPGSSVGPLSQSTAPTSLVSSGDPRSAETTLRAHNGRFVTDSSPPVFCEPITDHSPSRLLPFPRQDAPRLCNPSVSTIEKAAAVKVFFESHYNELLSTKVTPRSMRCRQMERKLLAMAASEEQRDCKRQE